MKQVIMNCFSGWDGVTLCRRRTGMLRSQSKHGCRCRVKPLRLTHARRRAMKDGPVIANIAALLGDPARANMLSMLMDGRALTVSELAEAAGVALPTASGHLAKLEAAGLLVAEKQGRHRYFRLSGHD